MAPNFFLDKYSFCFKAHTYTVITMFFVCFSTSYYSFSQTPDFNVQHIQDEVSSTGGTNTNFTPVNSLSSTLELANNNRKTHAGSNIHGGNMEGDDMSGARQLTSNNTLTYYRETASLNKDMRFNTSLWEYIGSAGGANELIVRGRYAISLNWDYQ